jgi:hypothetical protein
MHSKKSCDIDEVREDLWRLEAQVMALNLAVTWDILATDTALRGHSDVLADLLIKIADDLPPTPRNEIAGSVLRDLVLRLQKHRQTEPSTAPGHRRDTGDEGRRRS